MRHRAQPARRPLPASDIVRDALSTHLLTFLESSKRPTATEDQLVRATGAEPEDVATSLDALEEEGAVVRMPRHRWALADRSGMHTGTVKVNRSGRALVILDVPDAPLSIERGSLRPAMDGDRVLVQEEKFSRGGLRQARIHRVIERGRTTVVGVASPIAPRRLLPIDDRLGPYVIILTDDSEPAPPKQAVAATIVEYPGRHSDLLVRVDRVLGEVGKLETEIEAACLVRSIEQEFSDKVLAEADAFREPCEADFEGRTDLRGDLTVTVDPVDAKDHDDAMAIEETPQGWRITISIADVSWYVRPGTLLDREAFERSTSVYFPGRCVPMLPEKLSADLASLHPGVDRLAVSAMIDINRKGQVTTTSFARTVIHSMASLTYEQVQESLDADGFRSSVDRPALPEHLDTHSEGDGADAANLQSADRSAEAAPQTAAASALAATTCAALLAMAECADALHRQRIARGAIDMDLPESAIELDDKGEVNTIHRRSRRFAHRLVEEFMLAANEAVAEHIDAAQGAFLYRIHERPDDDAITQLSTRARALGLRLHRDGNEVTPTVLQKLLAQAEGRPESRQISMMVLRTMTRACYSADKEMHFGLASRCYTHFTSPIRRYPDIVAHRALLARIGADANKPLLPTKEALRPVATHTSSRERRAMDAERDVAAAAAVLYMARHVGRRLEGTVSGVDRFGFWVELDVAFVEGLVHIGKMREYFDFVPERMELQSRVSSASIRIGQRIKVRVLSVDLAARRTELEPA